MTTYTPLVIAVIYFVGLSVIFGIVAKRKVKTSKDYFTASNRLLWPMVMCTFVLAPLGSGHTSSLWEQASVMGVSVVWWGILVGAFFIPIFMLWFGPWFRKLNVETFPQALEKLFGKKVGLYNASLAPAAWLGIAISEIMSTATAIYCLTGGAIPFTPGCVLIAGVITIVYMIFAGNLQASYMNLVNAIMLIAGSFIAIFYLGGWLNTNGYGGYEGVAQIFADAGNGWMTNVFHIDGNILYGVMLPVVILHVFAASSEHCMYLPVMAAKNTREVRKGVFPAALINASAAFPWVIMGLVGVALIGLENTTPKLVVPDLLLTTFPPALIGIVMVALLCANLSTGSGLLLSMAHVITDDIVVPIPGKKNVSEKKHMRISYLMVILCTAAGVIPALKASVAMPIFFFCFSVGLPIFVCYFLGMIWKINRKVTWVTLLASLAVNVWWTFACPAPIASTPFANSFYVVLIVAFGVNIVGNLFTKGEKGMLRQIKEKNV